MKASLKQVLTSGLMATLLLPGFLLAAGAENEKSSSDSTQKSVDVNKNNKSSVADSGPYGEVNARMVRLERKLVEDLANGRLSPSKTEELQKAIEQVSELEAQFRKEPGKYTNWQNIQLNSLIDKISETVDRSEHDRDLASADLQFTREDLSERIELAGKQHRLSPQELTDIKQHFNRINGLEAMLRKYQGRLTYVDKLMLCIEYDHLAERLSGMLSALPLALPDITATTGNISDRIAEGVKLGKISEAQAQEFKQKISELRAKEAESKKAAFTTEQIIALGLDMDAVANKVELLIEPGTDAQNLDRHLKLLDRKIALSFDEGSLSPLETLELKEDLDEIQAAKVKDSASGSIKDEDQLVLKLDIARLEGRLERQLHGPNRLNPGGTIVIAHLSHRISQALEAKRLTDDEAKALKQDLRVLNKKKFEYMKADDGMTSEQALQLGEDLQRLAARLEKSMKDRDMDLPNIDGIKQALENKIGEYTIAGQLAVGDARTLVSTLANLSSVKAKYSASDNVLDSREKFALAFELERMVSNLEEQMHDHAASFPGVEIRRAQIEALVNEGISSGRLDAVTADYYKQKLQENGKLEKQYRADNLGLTGEKALELVATLEGLWEQLDRELREKAVTTSDLVSLEGNVEKKIRQGMSYGLLSPAEAESLRQTYDGVVASFTRMRAEAGGLSYGERLAFAYGFQRLIAYVERNLRSNPLVLPNLEAQRTAAEQKIGNLLATGRLPVQDAQDLKALLDQITSNAAERQASGGGLSYQEGLVVTFDINRLEHRIEEKAAELKNPLPNVDELQRAADKRIEEAKDKHQITAAQYKAYKADLDRIAVNEANFRTSDESLNYAEAINLMLEIRRLKDEVEALKKVPAHAPAKKSTESKKAAGRK